MSTRLPLRLLPPTSRTFLSRPYTTATATVPAPSITPSPSPRPQAGLAYSFMELYPSVKIKTPLTHLTPTTSDEVYLVQMRKQRDALPVVLALRSDPQLNETVAYVHQTRSTFNHSLTATTLRGKGKIALPPLVFKNVNSTECAVVIHLGRNLCGHEGIIHGGMLGTILDEMSAFV
ncbi:hypothetical protein BC938DRAFT_478008, partial [Jimgerdemannia flammicorona]